MRCEICGINCEPYDSEIYSRNLGEERSFHQEFWASKGIKKDANDTFESCRECDKKLKNYLAEELIKELNQKNLVDIEGVYLSSYCEKNFSSKDYWQKFQNALFNNIKSHSKEWKIVEVKFLGNDKKIRKYTMFIHQSVKLEYEGDILKDKCFEGKKMLFKHNFPISSEQWNEIETKISSEQKQNSQLSKNTGIVSEIIIVSGIIIFLSFLIYLVIAKRNKNRKI